MTLQTAGALSMYIPDRCFAVGKSILPVFIKHSNITLCVCVFSSHSFWASSSVLGLSDSLNSHTI